MKALLAVALVLVFVACDNKPSEEEVAAERAAQAAAATPKPKPTPKPGDWMKDYKGPLEKNSPKR